METVGRKAGFLLDRMRRRPRPRNRQTRKSLCQAGHEEGVLDLGANGSGSIDNEVGHVRVGANSTATRGYDEPRHRHRVTPISARSARRAAPCSPSSAIRHDRDGGITSCGVQLRRGSHLPKTAACRSRNDRQASGKLVPTSAENRDCLRWRDVNHAVVAF